ncbi:MAG: protein-L-isoaspartate O-methyltransferase [Planctomycetota bacterium]
MTRIDGQVHERSRQRLVRNALAQCPDERVVEAMAKLPRHWFLPDDAQGQAYVDAPMPIGAGQTISQPSLIAHMLAQLRLRPGYRVLDIGAGSGYATALLAMLVGPEGAVFARERQGVLAERAKILLADIASDDWAPITIEHADGSEGWPEWAPYDAIHVAAAFPTDSSALARQLSVDGRLIQPVTKARMGQQLQLIIRHPDDQFEIHDDLPVRFVPIVEGKA